MHRYFKSVAGICSGNYIRFWESKALSDENIPASSTTDYILHPQLFWH